MAWSGLIALEGEENFNLIDFRGCCYFEGKPEGVAHAPSKIRNLSVTQKCTKAEDVELPFVV
jgi:hypothetical protein